MGGGPVEVGACFYPGDFSLFLICSVFFVSKGNLFDVYFTTLLLV